MQYFVNVAVTIHLVMTITEMVVMKYIYISKFSRVAAINEKFISTTLTLLNVVIIVINLMLRLVTKELETSPWYNIPPQYTLPPYRTVVQTNIVK